MVAIPVAAVIISRAASNSIQYQAFVSLPARGRTVSLLFDSYCSETERVWQWSGAPAKNARRLLSVQKAWTKETSRPAVDTPGLTKPGVDELVSLGSRRGQPPLAVIGHARRLQQECPEEAPVRHYTLSRRHSRLPFLRFSSSASIVDAQTHTLVCTCSSSPAPRAG